MVLGFDSGVCWGEGGGGCADVECHLATVGIVSQTCRSVSLRVSACSRTSPHVPARGTFRTAALIARDVLPACHTQPPHASWRHTPYRPTISSWPEGLCGHRASGVFFSFFCSRAALVRLPQTCTIRVALLPNALHRTAPTPCAFRPVHAGRSREQLRKDSSSPCVRLLPSPRIAFFSCTYNIGAVSEMGQGVQRCAS